MINWIKSIFKRNNNPYRNRKPILMLLIDSYFEQRSMRGYIRENGMCNILMQRPSKGLMKRYGLSYDDSLEVWAIIEKYVNGDLIEKPLP